MHMDREREAIWQRRLKVKLHVYKSRNPWSRQKLAEAVKDFSPRPVVCWKCAPANTLVLCFWFPEPYCCCCSVTQLCPTLCDPMDSSTSDFPVHHQLPEIDQTHMHRVGDAIQISHPLSSPSPPAFNLSQHQGLFQWVGSSHQVAKVLKLQLQQQSFQWIFGTDFL